jgi:nucleotide-binding universal stress UspA family protein
MGAYRTVLVGTDGSDTSLHAVARAAQIARDSGATLHVACAYVPTREQDTARDRDVLGTEAYQLIGSAPAEDTVRTARTRAEDSGARDVRTQVVQGRPADVLVNLVREHDADLLVVGNRGLNGLAGRLLGSVPLEVARRAGTDVLIVHTT